MQFLKKIFAMFIMLFGTCGWVLADPIQSSGASIIFEKKELQIGSKKIVVEVADTPEKQARGLMFRRTLGDNEGMFFIFDRQEILNFWAKNTFIPLSIGFFNQQGFLVDIKDLEPVKSILQVKNIPQVQSSVPARYALEVPQGWFKKNDIKLGAKIKGHKPGRQP